MKLQLLYSRVRKAIDDYHMIDKNDTIAIGLSGGKDSLTLLYALSGLRKFYTNNFKLIAIMVNLGYSEFETKKIEQLCKELDVPLTIVDTEISKILQLNNPENISCSLCAKLRKGALNAKAKELNCTKVAYAHHQDDVVETVMMSQIFEGHYYCFPPVTYLTSSDLTVIRPLIYVTEAEIKGFKNKYDLPVENNPCPKDGHSKREYVKQLLNQINRDNPGAKKRMFSALCSSTVDGWAKN
ncbi:tRNA lysidine(34) synthetase [Lachnobacterium bovis]|uniref:tRNA lysidine(34) synthetase n=1 Tax=Lachnobacterium bovis TaxID=140626 RepID=UPI0003B4D7C3|nr:ATP-binding protein [Lachnobacterium bovis]